MANNFKLKTKASVGVSSQTVYTVPSATTTTIIGISLANVSGTGINVNVSISRASSDSVSLARYVPIPQGSTLEFMQGNKVVLEATDSILVSSDVANSLDCAVTILEMT